MVSRPVLARYRQIAGRTVEVLHPDTGDVLGTVGYTSKAAARNMPWPAGWWYDASPLARTSGAGLNTRDDAVRQLRGLSPAPEPAG